MSAYITKETFQHPLIGHYDVYRLQLSDSSRTTSLFALFMSVIVASHYGDDRVVEIIHLRMPYINSSIGREEEADFLPIR